LMQIRKCPTIWMTTYRKRWRKSLRRPLKLKRMLLKNSYRSELN
jgi:hypothetical protein